MAKRMLMCSIVLLLSAAIGSDGLDAQGQTVSAKGSVTTNGISCNLGECHSGGSGAKISFSFTGELTPPSPVAFVTSGSFSASFADTGYQVKLISGTATIQQNFHSVSINGTCETRDRAGNLVPVLTGPCFGFAQDNTPNGGNDVVFLEAFTPQGFINACCQVASGNINIE